MGANPTGTVVALGEGLETQFWRLDNGEMRWLTVACSLMVFDVVPEVMLELAGRTSGREGELAVALWTWPFSAAERAAISSIPGVAELRDLNPPLTRDLASLGIAAVRGAPAASELFAARVPGVAGRIPAL